MPAKYSSTGITSHTRCFRDSPRQFCICFKREKYDFRGKQSGLRPALLVNEAGAAWMQTEVFSLTIGLKGGM